MSGDDPSRPSEPGATPPAPPTEAARLEVAEVPGDASTTDDVDDALAEGAWAPLASPIEEDDAWQPLARPSDPPPPVAGRRRRAPRPLPRALGAGEEVAPLTYVARGLGLLFAIGLSLGLMVWELRDEPRLLSYVQANVLPARGRNFLLADMFGTGVAICALALLVLVVKRRTYAKTARRVCDVAWRLAPLALVGFVPLLVSWELWVGRELTFLMLATIFGLGLQGLGRAAFSSPPLGLFGRWTTGLRARGRRFAARHPRLTTGLPLGLVVFGAAAYAIYFGAVTIISHHDLRTSSFDLGLEENILWNALHGSRPFFKSSPLGGPTMTHFGNHATFISYPLALVYAICQRAETLLVIQAVLVGGAALPLFFYARRHVGAWTACLLAYVYLLYPPVHGANLYDFHYLSIGVFFLWLSLYALDNRRPFLTVFAVLCTLAIREDVAAGLTIVGAYLLLTGQRPRAGLVVASIALVFFAVVKLVAMPRAIGGASSFLFIFRDLVPAGEDSFGGVLKTVFGNPGYTLHTLIERDKLYYLLQIFTPLAFLPLRRPVGLLCCMLGFLFTLLSTGYAPFIQTSFQYTANWTTYLFMAMVGNLVWVSRPLAPGDVKGPARRKAWLLTLIVSTLIGSYEFGAVFQRHTIRGGFGPYTFGTSPTDLEHRKAIHVILGEIPPNAKIVASEQLVPQVSNRADAYTLRVGTYDAEYLLFSLPIYGDEQRNAFPLLQSNQFGVVDVQEPYVLARRGAPTSRNAAVIARMH
ncbi:MAG TPA: DUF2079 domain-containing protein [Polyangia bacterium]|jgi:uncharacterized membrane protein|nr:DUF2079 domain-containing protein [Polyangia bacterium]